MGLFRRMFGEVGRRDGDLAIPDVVAHWRFGAEDYFSDGFEKGSSLSPIPDPADFSSKLRAHNVDIDNANYYFDGETPSEIHPGVTLAFEQCRSLASLSVVAPFVGARVTQVALHGTRRRDRFSPGYEIVLEDEDVVMTAADRKEALRIREAFERGKVPVGARMEAMARDSFSMDHACAEVPYVNGKPFMWMPVDSATIRFAKPSKEALASGRLKMGDRYLVQVDRHASSAIEHIVKRWQPKNMMVGVRRPRTDIRVQGYGYPEIVEAIDVITELLYIQNYNSLFFKNGMQASTILMMMSNMTPKLFGSFQRQLHAQLKGVENVHRMAMVLLNPGSDTQKMEKLDKLDLAKSNKDMEFSQYLDTRNRLLAAILGMDLAELGLGPPQEAQGGGVLAQQKVLAKEKRLRADLNAFEAWFNVWFIKPINPAFRIVFLGMDAPSKDSWLAQQKAKTQSIFTLNEVRKQADMKPLPFKWADECPLDPLAVQMYMAEKAEAREDAAKKEEQEAAEAAQNGGGGGDEDPSGIDFGDPKNWRVTRPGQQL